MDYVVRRLEYDASFLMWAGLKPEGAVSESLHFFNVSETLGWLHSQ